MSEAICPAGISSFFEVCDKDSNGTSLQDPLVIGARGGGFGIARGVTAHVSVRKATQTRIGIRINSKRLPEARTTEWALDRLLKDAAMTLDVRADIKVSVPIGAGYGTSAAGTAAACLALADAAQIPVTLNELGKLTHIAEVVNRTGLGTASALFVGGFILVTEPGAPGTGSVDRLLFPKDHKIICVYLGPIPTPGALSQADLAGRVNPLAQRAMLAIRRTPDLQTFLSNARKFSDEAGYQTSEIARIMDVMTSAGAVGAAQNMIGEAVHAVAETSKVPRVVRAVRKGFPRARVFVTQLEERGVRLAETRNPKH